MFSSIFAKQRLHSVWRVSSFNYPQTDSKKLLHVLLSNLYSLYIQTLNRETKSKVCLFAGKRKLTIHHCIYVCSLKSDFMVEFFHHIHKMETLWKGGFFQVVITFFSVAFAKVNSLDSCLLLRVVKSEVKLCISQNSNTIARKSSLVTN